MSRPRAAPLLVAFALALAACAGCDGCGGDERAEAVAQVRALFDAAGRGDCAAVIPVHEGIEDEDDCRDYLHDWEHHQVQFVGVGEVTPDSRHEHTWLVRVRIRRDGTESELVVVAKRGDEAWTLLL